MASSRTKRLLLLSLLVGGALGCLAGLTTNVYLQCVLVLFAALVGIHAGWRMRKARAALRPANVNDLPGQKSGHID